MANLKAKINQSGRLKGKAASQTSIVAKSATVGTAMRLGDLTDVNTSGQADAVMLQYDASGGEYIVTTQIENIEIIGGTY
jgi:hypothetical protein